MHTRHIFTLMTILLALGASATSTHEAHAFGYYADDLPSAVPQGRRCVTCHLDPQGRGTRNEFGDDVAYYFNGGPDWSAIYAMDSDRDGYTNGQELGDPNGAWSIGDPYTMFISAPGDDTSTPCGNDQIDPKEFGDEACDGIDLDGKTCANFGGTMQQVLSCTDACEFNLSECISVNPPGDMGPDMMVEDDTPDLLPDDESIDLSVEDASQDSSPSADATLDDATKDEAGDQAEDGAVDLIAAPSTPAPTLAHDGCSQTGDGEPSPTPALMIGMGIVGLFGVRRRRA